MPDLIERNEAVQEDEMASQPVEHAYGGSEIQVLEGLEFDLQSVYTVGFQTAHKGRRGQGGNIDALPAPLWAADNQGFGKVIAGVSTQAGGP